ncbi:hypothetical protein SISSUDRAFT_1054071 [Sistotremastrum suecicum HHB10207 ss-3]|uniref:SAC domain-containing protein n=1 Tax=Sistotremastrum suecicum HHB10207 ss-3 TaxID=1314776 RepID=A0A165YT67_9AGAM|nr:hypothetical protein SISSUDRAFT_1054071 [Sistotremastrum suecicum HHB10207 ss-3]
MKRIFNKSKKPTLTIPLPGLTSVASALHAGVAATLLPKFTVPPLPHPCPYSRILVLATKKGLFFRPDIDSHSDVQNILKFEWGKEGRILEIPDSVEDDLDWTSAARVWGIIGIMRLYCDAFVIVITGRKHSGHLLHESRMVYSIKAASAIPLHYEGAKLVISAINAKHARTPAVVMSTPSGPNPFEANMMAKTPSSKGGSTSTKPRVTKIKFLEPTKADYESRESDYSSDSSGPSSGTSSPGNISPTYLVKPLHSRLASWHHEAAPSPIEPSADQSLENKLKKASAVTIPEPEMAEEHHSELDDKILREAIKEFTKGGMLFSYSCDISHSLQWKIRMMAELEKDAPNEHLTSNIIPESFIENEHDPFDEPHATLPLWRRFDTHFWWNEQLTSEFADAGLHSYIIPIMQGFCQTASFTISASENDESVSTSEDIRIPVHYTVISRRSKNRAGLRYQRRGIDDNADVANYVETETIMQVTREKQNHIFTFIQIRGSIPLFWSQLGNTIKPIPQLSTDRTQEQQVETLSRHFDKSVGHYGTNTIVNLAGQKGKEAPLSKAYKETVADMNSPDVCYYDYDFHEELKGMRYEKIASLIETLDDTFQTQGFLWISDKKILSQQKGVFRINCIDCLDRTNVVESAFARSVLQTQLSSIGIAVYALSARSEVDVVFNDMWANNGDMISREYAGTTALKSDYTRTGKRDFGGILHDGMNSIARVFSSTFSDWFHQSVIDYMLGHRSLSVFSEFLVKLSSTDPHDLIRLSKVRAAAIESCSETLLPEDELLCYGWTLLGPVDFDTRLTEKFVEKILLLSNAALYIVQYDYGMEKVQVFTRVPLEDVTEIRKGAYILSPLEEGSRDPEQNSGFVVSFVNSGQETRVRSYSVRNTVNDSMSKASSQSGSSGSSTSTPQIPKRPQAIGRASTLLSQILTNASLAAGHQLTTAAFKALPVDSATPYVSQGIEGDESCSLPTSCRESVDLIVTAIKRAYEIRTNGRKQCVVEEDIVSLAEAQRATSVYSKLEYGVKRLLWLG